MPEDGDAIGGRQHFSNLVGDENDALAYRMELTREPELRFHQYAKPPQQSQGFATAPVFIVVCGDLRTKEAYPLIATLHQGRLIFASSLANAYLYMHLAATTLGLGSQWVTATNNPFEQNRIKELLGIPKELEVYDMMVVGYPESEPGPRLVRAKEEIAHYDSYDRTKFRTDEEMKNFILALRGGKK